MTRLFKLLHTFTFRLGLVYVGLFSLSIILLFGFIYSFAVNYLNAQADDVIRSRYALLLDEYHANGTTGLENRIGELVESDDEGAEIYLLVNNKGERLAGNLEAWPEHASNEGVFEKDGQWIRFSIEGTRNHPASIGVRALSVSISRWRKLLIGQTMLSKRRVEQTIKQAFWASLAVTLVLAFLGAAIVTQSVMHRLGIINRSADTIMHGHLSTRIPFTPGGDEFDELAHHLNNMLDRTEALLKSLSDIANNIAHDLRSPLNRIVARTEAGLRGMKEGNVARRLLEQNVDDMQALIGTFNSILHLCELEAHADPRPFPLCDLSIIIGHLVEFYEPLAAEKSITLEAHVAEPLFIRGEHNLLAQAFANVLENALKFTPEGGHITISAHHGERGVVTAVADTGPGIPEAYRDKVFEKFFRLEESRHTSGNGLGLSLVAAIARLHGAEITLGDNHPGLRVIILFPIA